MIEVKQSDLYMTGKIIVFNDGEQVLIREKLTLDQFNKYAKYTVKQNDELTRISYNAYKNLIENASQYWWVIADVNNIFNPFELEIGAILFIPNILELKLIIDSL